MIKSFKDKITELVVESLSKGKVVLQESIDPNDLASKLTAFSGSTADFVKNYIPEALNDKTFFRGVVDYLEDQFHHHKDSAAVKSVIDGLAHSKEVGGATWHRIADGRHSIAGAVRALNEEMPDLPVSEKLVGTFQHLWADMQSVSGVPIWAFDNIEQFKEFCAKLKLPESVVADFLTVNTTELLSTALSVIPSIYNFNEMQSQDFARLAGRLGMLTVGGSQFEALSSVFSIFALGQSMFLASTEGRSTTEVLLEMVTEGGFTGMTLASTAFLPFPLSLAAPLIITNFKLNVQDKGFDVAFDNYHDSLSSMKDTIMEFDLAEFISKVRDLKPE